MNIRIGEIMKKEESSKTQIPTSNYVKLAFIVVVTLFGVLLLRNWYVSSRNYELNIPVIKDTLKNEINEDEVYNYVRENENAILYIGVANDEGCRDFEKEFNTIIRDRKLENTIMYLNITQSKNKDKLIKEFNKFYDTKLLGYPSIVIFEEGKVKATLTVKVGQELKIEDTILFLDHNEVVSEDL